MVKLFYLDEAEEWYAAKTAESALKVAQEIHGKGAVSVDEFEEVTEDELENLVYIMEDTGQQHKFGDALKNMIHDDWEFPCLFASYEQWDNPVEGE